MKNRRPRKYKLKYLGRIKDDRKTKSKTFRLILRAMRSYPCLPTEEFLVETGNVFPVNELKKDGEL
jgi:hypothetical protein